MLGTLVRKTGDLVFGPANARLARAGMSSRWVHALALASAAASSIALVGRRLAPGLALIVVHGLFDYLDGGLRRAREQDEMRSRWLGMDVHVLVDKVSELMVFAGLAGGNWVGWPLALAAFTTSCAVTVLGNAAKNRLDVDPGRVLFDRSDRLFVLLLAGAFRAFGIGLSLVCAMNGIILLLRIRSALRAVGPGDRTA